jgi:hypothetical protein
LRELVGSANPSHIASGMSDEANPTGNKEAERTARESRLAKALRDNLRRRKEQERARAAPQAIGSDGLSDAPLSSKSKRRDGDTAD